MSGSFANAGALDQSSGVVRVGENHIEPLTEIIRLAWDPAASASGVRMARRAAAAVNPHGEGMEVPTFLFLSGKKPLGHLTTLPVRIDVDGEEHTAHWLKGFWVVPEHRNGPIGFLLVREALKQLGTTLSMVVQPAPRRLFQALGFIDFGQIPNFVRILQPTRVLRHLDLAATGLQFGPAWLAQMVGLARAPGIAHLLGAATASAFSSWTLTQPSGRDVLAIRPEELDPAAVDSLWERAGCYVSAAPCRDFVHLRARYFNRPGSYTALAAYTNGVLQGIATVRRPKEADDGRLRGIHLATLSDLVYPLDQPEVGARLLAAAERAALDLGAAALLCSGSHAALHPLLRRRAYLRLGGNVHFMARPGGHPLDHHDLADWWLMRADGEADDAL